MMRRPFALAAAVTLAVSGLAVTAEAAPPDAPPAAPPAAPPPAAGPQPVIVVLTENVDADRVAAEHARASGVRPDFVYRSAVKGYAATLPPARIEQLRRDPRVASIEPDRIHRLQPPQPVTVDPTQPAQEPSNAVRRIGALKSKTARIDGRDQRVDADIAILDSGIQSDHPDLNVAGGADCAPGLGWEDRDGHGTMVGGFAGAVDNSIGRVGVAPGARLWAVRVIREDGYAANSWLLCGLDWVTAHANVVEVANMSLGGPSKGTATECAAPDKNAILIAACSAYQRGVTLVNAAGNDAIDAATDEPSMFEASIAVSAIADTDGQPGGRGPAVRCLPGELDDRFASFSNYGAVVDLAAPGVCINSTFIGSQYGTGSGTSFSSPLVAGAAALYLARNPRATPAQVRQALIANGEPGPIPGDPDTFAEPVVNVSKF